MAKKKDEPEPSWDFLEGEAQGRDQIERLIWSYGLKKALEKAEVEIDLMNKKKFYTEEKHKGILAAFYDFLKRQKEVKKKK